MRRGVTMIELIIASAVIIIIGLLGFSNLSGRTSKTDLDMTTQKAVGLLREAQSRSMNKSNGTQWGVHFDNTSTSSAFFVMFSGASYSTSTSVSRNQLSKNIQFATSTLPAASSTDVVFSTLTGLPNKTGTTTIGFEWRVGVNLMASSSVTLNSGGLITY